MQQPLSETITAVADDWRARTRLAAMQAISLGGIAFAASMLGIMSRPSGFLATFWPANPILLGLLARNPRLATPGGWIAAAIGYMAADLATGGRGHAVVWLAVANLAGVAVGYLLFRRLPPDDVRLRRPLSVMYFFFICVLTATASAVIGYSAVPELIDARPIAGLSFWVATELLNSIILLPVILSAPPPSALTARFFLVTATAAARAATRRPNRRSLRQRLLSLRPLAALLLSMTASAIIGGPGAIVFPIPALLWCALTYSLFNTTVITLLLCVWMLIAISIGWVDIPVSPDATLSTMSIRLGICLLALGPLTVASINSARDDVVRELDRAVSFDFLTGALTRSALMKRADHLFRGSGDECRPIAVLMLDIDHFKRINDTHGHDGGDRALVTFARVVEEMLENGHLFGRFGGDEFALVLPRTSHAEAAALADRLQAAIASTPVALDAGGPVRITVSIGLAVHGAAAPAALERLLKQADDAMYRAKIDGRNRVNTSPRH